MNLKAGRWALVVVAIFIASQGYASEEKKKRAPSGIRIAGPEVLAGPWVRPPRVFEQTEVFGEPSTFPRNLVDPFWRPESEWDTGTELNDFNPSRWYRAPIDPDWETEPAITEEDDVTNSNPSRWQKGTLDPNWHPQDGFNGKAHPNG